MAEKFPELLKDINPLIEDCQQTSSKLFKKLKLKQKIWWNCRKAKEKEKKIKAAVNLVEERITFKTATFSLIMDSKTAAIKARRETIS